MPAPTLAKLLRQAREKQGLSLRQVAAKCSLSHTHIHYLEQGKGQELTVSTIRELSVALDISPIAILRACL